MYWIETATHITIQSNHHHQTQKEIARISGLLVNNHFIDSIPFFWKARHDLQDFLRVLLQETIFKKTNQSNPNQTDQPTDCTNSISSISIAVSSQLRQHSSTLIIESPTMMNQRSSSIPRRPLSNLRHNVPEDQDDTGSVSSKPSPPSVLDF